MSTPKGKTTFYPNKVKNPVTTALTLESRDEIERVAAAVSVITGKECSRSDLLEHSWRTVRGISGNAELTKHLRTIGLPVLSGTDSSLGVVYTETPAPEPEAAEAAVPA